MTTADRIRSVIADQLGVDPITVTDSKTLRGDLNADSLDLVELLMDLEDEFGITLADEDIERCATVGEVVSMIAGQVPA